MSIDLISFARAHGIRIDRTPEFGKWARFRTDDRPKKKNGIVRMMGDYALVKNARTMTEFAVWKPDEPSNPIEQRRLQRARQQLRNDELRQQASAIRGARDVFARLAPLRGGHPYLEAKGLTMEGCAGLRVGTIADVRLLMQWDRNYEQSDKPILMVPGFKGTHLMSVQMIWPGGRKLYAKHCPMQGATFTIRRPGAAITAHCEGLATGLAVFQSVPLVNVIVYFDLGNMVRTAPLLGVTGMQVVCADNDHATYESLKARGLPARNPGIEDGTKAAEAIGCGLAYPPAMDGVSDFADLRQVLCEKGAAAVRDLVMRNARMVFGARSDETLAGLIRGYQSGTAAMGDRR